MTEKINTDKKCDYGCGKVANYKLGNEKLCCSKSQNSCPKIREKMSKAQSGKNNPNYGKKFSKETKEKMSKAKSGKNHPLYGKHHSEETKEKIGAVGEKIDTDKKCDYGCGQQANYKFNNGKLCCSKSYHDCEGYRDKLSEANSGKNNAIYGKIRSKKTRKKISEANKGKHHSKETKEKMSETHKDKKRSKETKEKMSKSHLEYMKKNNDLYSKISQECFWKIYNELPKDLQKETYFAELNQEYFFRNLHYLADFYIKPLNLIIEFFGNYWHMNPDKYNENDFNEIYSKKASQAWKEDNKRIENLKNNGHELFIIWEKEYKDDFNKINILKRIKENRKERRI